MSALCYLSFMSKIGCHGPLLFQPESIANAHYFFQFSHMLGCLAHASLILSFMLIITFSLAICLGCPAHVSLVLSFIYAKSRVPWPITLSTWIYSPCPLFLQFSHMLGCLANASLMLSFIYAKIGCHGPLVVQHESIAQMVPMPPLTCHLQSPNIGWPFYQLSQVKTASGVVIEIKSIWCHCHIVNLSLCFISF